MEITRNQGESMGSMLRRFSRLGQQSGLISTAKKRQYHRGKKNETKEKKGAMMAVAFRAVRKKLKRLGKDNNESFQEEKQKIKRDKKLRNKYISQAK